jgi:hypothetical protein
MGRVILVALMALPGCSAPGRLDDSSRTVFRRGGDVVGIADRCDSPETCNVGKNAAYD